MTKNSIAVVIPTMWRMPEFENYLAEYADNDDIEQIIVIDNDYAQRPKSLVLQHPKITLVCYAKNIYVNPAWNEGYYRSKSDILCLLNDDIHVDGSIFKFMSQLDFAEIDIIGVHLKGSVDNYHIVKHPDQKEELIRLNVDKTQPIGGQSYAFGVCMFMPRSRYKVIPSLYQIWYGDDYLIQNCKNIYTLKTSKITGEISKTIVNFDKNSDIHRRMQLDSHNAFSYNHFLNVQNWDLVKSYAKKSTTKKTIKSDLLDAQYRLACKTRSDINENLPLLYELAKDCSHVTEFGVRKGMSTRAFLNSNVVLRSFDISLDAEVNQLFNHAKELGKDVEYIQADVRKITIEDTDLLFIDTWHIYEQLKLELDLHANHAKKYIVFHDTYTYGLSGENGKDRRGLLSAIIEFVIKYPEWKFKIYRTNNNGMTVLERRNYEQI